MREGSGGCDGKQADRSAGSAKAEGPACVFRCPVREKGSLGSDLPRSFSEYSGLFEQHWPNCVATNLAANRLRLLFISDRIPDAGELADIRLYVSREADTADLGPVTPEEHAIALFQAFDRYLSIRDRHTFSTALARINETLAETAAKDATFVPVSEAVADSSLSLGAAPDLSTLRNNLRVFINQLKEDEGPPEATE